MSAAVLVLDPRLDLRAAGPLVEALRAHRGADLVLDAGRVGLVGALAVQAIRAAARAWAEDGHALSIVNAPDEFVDQLGLFGFSIEAVTGSEARR